MNWTPYPRGWRQSEFGPYRFFQEWEPHFLNSLKYSWKSRSISLLKAYQAAILVWDTGYSTLPDDPWLKVPNEREAGFYYQWLGSGLVPVNHIGPNPYQEGGIGLPFGFDNTDVEWGAAPSPFPTAQHRIMLMGTVALQLFAAMLWARSFSQTKARERITGVNQRGEPIQKLLLRVPHE